MNRTKPFCLLYFTMLMILIGNLSHAQLSAFSLSVTKTDETCEGNGTLSFNVTGTTVGATVLYSIYLLPDVTTTIGVVSTNSFTGLSSGTYRVIATQVLGSESNTQQQDIPISNLIIPLVYNLTGQNVMCVDDGQITVSTSQGTAVSYEIISGPVLKPLQASNTFMDLLPGVYVIRVFDNCGDGIVQTYTLFSSDPGSGVSQTTIIESIDCDSAIFTQTINSPGGNLFYPIDIVYTLTPTTGPALVFTQTLIGGSNSSMILSHEIPVTSELSYAYTLVINDGCGNVYTMSGNMNLPSSAPIIVNDGNNCGSMDYVIKQVATATVIAAPAGSGYDTPEVLSEGTEPNTFPMPGLLPGDYEILVTTDCGPDETIYLTVEAPTQTPPGSSVNKGCESGFGSVRLGGVNPLVSVSIEQAPSGFPVPQEVSFNINPVSGAFTMNSLPVGNYMFHTLDVCGNAYDLPVVIGDYQLTTNTTVIEHCGSFDLQFIHANNGPISFAFWLQKYNPQTGQWQHPITGSGYNEGDLPNNTNSLSLYNNVINYNISSSGHFRILGRHLVFGNGGSVVNCYVVLDEFDFLSTPKINNVYSFSCENGNYDIIVDAVGIDPLSYKITAKAGVPFFIDNINSNVFLQLEAAVYSFQVEDGCGNILNADFEVGTSVAFPITMDSLCSGENGTLTVPYISFLSYEWWKGTDTTEIISTSNVLDINSFDPASDTGTYNVRVFIPDNPNSCIDFVSSATISTEGFFPEAGEGSTVAYCGTTGTIDLFSLLSGPFDTDGVWEETTNSGSLTGNVWDSAAVLSGTYGFKYKVTGTCNNSDQTTVTVTIKPVPPTPVISFDPAVCNHGSLQLHASGITAGAYQWSGPNGFISDLQNPLLENIDASANGIYALKIVSEGCESVTVSTIVEVSSLPEFTLEGNCTGNETAYILTATAVGTAFDPDSTSYSWTGPEGFSANENPTEITGRPDGLYTLTITNADGCSKTMAIDVPYTLCQIPKGISANNDGDNDTFDLTGYNVQKLIIFSRYGRNVFERENYTNQWHGQDFKDRELPDATYFYWILLASGEERTGWVYKTNLRLLFIFQISFPYFFKEVGRIHEFHNSLVVGHKNLFF